MNQLTRKVVAAIFCVAVAAPAFASSALPPGVSANSIPMPPWVMQDANSSASIDPGWGMNSWRVDGVDQLFRQWFFYRTIGMSKEEPLGSLTLINAVLSDANGSGQDNNLFVSYGGQGFEIDVNFTLNGFPAGLGELIQIRNTSGDSVLEISFFQYADFDLGFLAGDDEAELLNPWVVRQWDDDVNVQETVATPAADRWEIDYWGTTIWDLTDDDITNLRNLTSPLGPGDVTWAFQWDFVIAAGDAEGISKDKRLDTYIIPEPLTMLGLFLGVGSLGGYIRRRVR